MGRKQKEPIRRAVDSWRSDTAGGNLGPIRTYEDVADSEDEFHTNRDRILLDEGSSAKRQRRIDEQDAFLQPSDEEILRDLSSDSDHSDEEEENDDYDQDAHGLDIRDSSEGKGRDLKRTGPSRSEGSPEEDEDAGGWGSAKKDYYDADNIETEADALEEEAEARRLQQKKLQKMTAEDFGFDEDDWLGTKANDNDGTTVTEILKEVEITPEMGLDERMNILRTRYPEFESLASEFTQLEPVLRELQVEVSQTPTTSAIVKSRALAAYLAVIAMYFAILTSAARADPTASKPFDAAHLREHSIMAKLLKCRQVWSVVSKLENTQTVEDMTQQTPLKAMPSLHLKDSGETFAVMNQDKITRTTTENGTKGRNISSHIMESRKRKLQAVDEELKDLSRLTGKPRLAPKSKKTAHFSAAHDDDSDFGEEESMDVKMAAAKAAKRKSLRFYTSQIAQKANKRADAGRDAGGDADLPYRERLRDRQARLNAEAEKRGKKLDQYGRGTALEDNSNDEDDDAHKTAAALRDEEDDYYDMVAQTSKKRKEDKLELYETLAAAKAAGQQVRVTEGEVGDDGKRAIGYVIEKNKGLAPKRKKDVRNPRVKKRKKYEEKKKKLASTRAVYKGGEERGGYGGEKTGIKTGIIKSVKL